MCVGKKLLLNKYRMKANINATYAAGSPVTDGKLLFASFSSRGIFAYTLDGELRWQVDLGDMQTRFGWGEAVTPAIADDKLIINWDQEKKARSSPRSMPQLANNCGASSVPKKSLLGTRSGSQSGRSNTSRRQRHTSSQSYDASNGQEVWACGGQTVNAIPSPVQFKDTIIALSGYRAAAGFAIPINSQGDVTDSAAVRWKVDQGTPYVPSPSLSGDRLYFTQANSDVLSVIDATSGNDRYSQAIIGRGNSVCIAPRCWRSRLLCGSRRYTVVIKDDDTLETVSVNALGEPIDASPIAVDNQLFLRTWTKVYCIAE